MRLLIRLFIVLAAISASTAAMARPGTTTTDLALRAAPSPKAALLLTVPAGSRVRIDACARGWCQIAWGGNEGYARQRGLAVETRRRVANGPSGQPEIWPIYPPYPYRAGHYPKLDWYHAMPPYVAISPSFYRKRFFLTAQERDRYRYMPHVFRGYAYGDGGGIEDVDTRKISDSVRETYRE